ncbi:MAG: hypothetical protein SGI88_12920, partial [Candidatus Hydrogenedentes bacterium]|nr:hypothetical protein [Candidatus Hydrogenedentota bacterium]
AFLTARNVGFDLATVLLGWGWTEANGGKIKTEDIETTFGIEKLRAHGFKLKSHGAVWLQDYGILPAHAKAMPSAELQTAMLAQQAALLETYADTFSVWEAMNEPNVTNVVGLPRESVLNALEESAALIKETPALTSLVNGAHEGDFGRRFAVYTLDNTSLSDWNRTYFTYLSEAKSANALDNIDVIGLQYYPGFHFNRSFGGLQGPATTPSWFIDTLERYAKLGKPLHITECSLPSSYDKTWISGYWREPWTPQTQADYAEMIFTLAYANPDVHSISWWDVLDTKSSVTTGGLCDAQGNPKPVLERLAALIASWKKK